MSSQHLLSIVYRPVRPTALHAGRVPDAHHTAGRRAGAPGVPIATANQSAAKATITSCQTEPFELKHTKRYGACGQRRCATRQVPTLGHSLETLAADYL